MSVFNALGTPLPSLFNAQGAALALQIVSYISAVEGNTLAAPIVNSDRRQYSIELTY